MALSHQPPLQKSPVVRILLVVAIGAVVASGIWLIIVRKTSTSKQNTAPAVSNTAVSAPSNLTFDTRVPSTVPDADADGLSDEDEAKLGTNPTSRDSDRDGLSDFDEVRVYRTEPQKPDTDADGHSDGEEVKKGFNPSGAGKLFDTIPPANTNT